MRSLALLVVLLAATPTQADPICSLTGELGRVSREWEKLTPPKAITSGTITISSSSGTYWPADCSGSTPETPKEKRERAARLIKEAETTEHRERTEQRWRELVRACFKGQP